MPDTFTKAPGATDAASPIPQAQEKFVAPVVAENPTDGSHLFTLHANPVLRSGDYVAVSFSDLFANQKSFKQEIEGWPYVHISRVDITFTPNAAGAEASFWLGPDLRSVVADHPNILAELNAHHFISTAYNLTQETKTLQFQQGMSMQIRPTPITALHPRFAICVSGNCYFKIDVYYTTGGLKRSSAKLV